MRFTPNRTTNAREALITIDRFNKGYVNLIDEARMDASMAKESNNMMQVSDGLWKTRWGTNYYGTELAAAPDGAAEYVKSDGTTELIAIADGKAWKSTDGGTWTEITGATFTAGLHCYFLQMGGYNTTGERKSYLYISNGTDTLARYDGTSLTTYANVDAPTNLSASLVASGLASGTFVYYAQVTALNDVGESVGSTEASITVNKSRDTWTSTTDKVVWSWTASAGANRYQIYLSDEMGYEKLLYSPVETNYTDNGTDDINPYVEPPLQNTTTGPKVKSMAVSGNIIWATNDSTDMYKVYFSGTGRDVGNFSDFYGGGWINLEKGGREIPVKVVHYQSGQGEGRATVLCKTPDGAGAVWQILVNSITVGDTSFSVPSAQKVVGSVGTESILGTVATGNDIAFPNRRGWYSLGMQAQFFNVLRTNERSSLIRPYWRSLISSKISGVASYFYDAKIFISVPTSTTGNDKIIIFDTERGNWAVDWSIGAKQFLEYTDTSGNSHFLFIPTSGTRLIELNENTLGDLGAPFNQSYISPLLPVSKKKTDILDLQEAILEVSRPRGVIKFQVLGIGKDNNFTTLATKTITNFGSNTGVGSDLMDGFHLSSTNDFVSGGAGAWAITYTAVPSTFTQSTTKAAIRRRAKIYAIQFKVFSVSGDTDFTILSLQAKGRLISRRLPSAWTN
jgi:hypothetical protein